MSWNYTDIHEFRSRVETISADVRAAAFNRSREQWQLDKLVGISPLSAEALNSGYYKYNPQKRLYVAGEMTPATCESDPLAVSSTVGDMLTVKLHAWETKYDLCQKNSCTASLEEKVDEKEFAVAQVMHSMLFKEFWEGYPRLGSYGLLNHPNGSVTPTPPPQTPVSGQTNFESKDANEIVGEIRDAMRGMINPNLAISDIAWSAAADKILGDGDNCNRAGDCILRKLSQSESTGTFTGTLDSDFFVMKYLDDVEIDGSPSNGVYIVWDEDAVDYLADTPEFLSPVVNKKRADAIRQVTTAGTIVKFTDSLRVVTGINELIA